jgi:hypothetical protein
VEYLDWFPRQVKKEYDFSPSLQIFSSLMKRAFVWKISRVLRHGVQILHQQQQKMLNLIFSSLTSTSSSSIQQVGVVYFCFKI